MSGLAPEGLVLIAVCVFMGWLVNVLVLDHWFQNGGPTIYGSRARLLLARVMIWTGAIGASAASLIVASILLPGVSVLAVLFGLQAMMLDYCSRVRYLPTSAAPQRSTPRISSPMS